MRVCVGVIVTLFMSAAMAAPPEETNKLTSLTPEEAEKLICTDDQCRPVMLTRRYTVTKYRSEERTHKRVINGEAREVQVPVRIPYTEDQQQSYTIMTRGNILSLNGLKELSCDTARVLSRHHGLLCLDGLNAITPDLAALLVSPTRRVTLNGVVAMSRDAANALVEQAGSIECNGLKRIDICTFETLRMKGGLPSSVTIECANTPIVIWKVTGGSPFSQLRGFLADQMGLPVNIDKKAFDKYGISVEKAIPAPPYRVMYEAEAISWLAQELSNDHPGAIVAVNKGMEISFQEKETVESP
jgi:hypothetical protein